MIIIPYYSRVIYILFDYKIINFKLDETIFHKNGIVCILCSWYKSDKLSKIVKENSEYNIVILANSLEEKKFFESRINCTILFCNHNAFLNENKFTILNSIYKKYDMVIDSAFHEYKNVQMAKKVENVIHVGYFKCARNTSDDKVVPTYGTLVNFINGEYKKLDHSLINVHYNQSLLGGIFSECEGACFASSQYLLCGLPVISIKSVGGRDIWYNDHNSIICENNEEAIYEACELGKQKLLSGEFNREKIRELHIKQMDEHRNTLIDYINTLLPKGEHIDAREVRSLLAFF